MRGIALIGIGILGLGAWIMNREDQVDVVARTIWGEARSEGIEGMTAVANVIVNRAESDVTWWGNDLRSVALKPWQFSAWNENDPNREKLLSVTLEDQAFALARQIAKQAVEGRLPDITGGATHYHTKAISPSWAAAFDLVADIGNHVFYRDQVA